MFIEYFYNSVFKNPDFPKKAVEQIFLLYGFFNHL